MHEFVFRLQGGWDGLEIDLNPASLGPRKPAERRTPTHHPRLIGERVAALKAGFHAIFGVEILGYGCMWDHDGAEGPSGYPDTIVTLEIPESEAISDLDTIGAFFRNGLEAPFSCKSPNQIMKMEYRRRESEPTRTPAGPSAPGQG